MFNFLKSITERLYIYRPKLKLPKLKDKKLCTHLLYAHPLLISIMFDMAWYCEKNDLPFNITSVIRSPSENLAVGGKSKTHETGRAFDLSTKNWSVWDIDTFVNIFNKKYKNDAAISRDGHPRLVVYHIGTAAHLHIQINAKYSKDGIWKEL